MRTTALQSLELVPAALILGEMILREVPGYCMSTAKSYSSLSAAGFMQLTGKVPSRPVASLLAAKLRVGGKLCRVVIRFASRDHQHQNHHS